MSKSLHHFSDEIITHPPLILKDGERTAEVCIIVIFRDDEGNDYRCEKVIKCRLRKDDSQNLSPADELDRSAP